MEITKDMQKVVADLEYLIGSECYNPNSYDGWTHIEGRAYRYPIWITSKDGKEFRIKNNVLNHLYLTEEDLSNESIEFMRYKFGSNILFVGKAIKNILKYLEDRYDLDFVGMEENRK